MFVGKPTSLLLVAALVANAIATPLVPRDNSVGAPNYVIDNDDYAPQSFGNNFGDSYSNFGDDTNNGNNNNNNNNGSDGNDNSIITDLNNGQLGEPGNVNLPDNFSANDGNNGNNGNSSPVANFVLDPNDSPAPPSNSNSQQGSSKAADFLFASPSQQPSNFQIDEDDDAPIKPLDHSSFVTSNGLGKVLAANDGYGPDPSSNGTVAASTSSDSGSYMNMGDPRVTIAASVIGGVVIVGFLGFIGVAIRDLYRKRGARVIPTKEQIPPPPALTQVEVEALPIKSDPIYTDVYSTGKH
ncbi:uncharacterized protein BJ171DRAFT_498497 [Polychytrium aggregatum]|uniref:uncharacterized protein n=1 Tax=Polychytrium aggregatum TaxID=110093 RepID=UPI0022FF11E1|nr:uncharacterized protein BJ171DRAFT_498497 [Polychytrium aggregatum]KAI9206053.1 hypothetical protein BJ171DRAFT_498497 [Polychytrium aggregatum]